MLIAKSSDKAIGLPKFPSCQKMLKNEKVKKVKNPSFRYH